MFEKQQQQKTNTSHYISFPCTSGLQQRNINNNKKKDTTYNNNNTWRHTNLELLHLDVEEEILVELRHAVLLAVFQQVLVEVEHGDGGLASRRLAQGVQELVLVLARRLRSTCRL